MIVRPKKPTAYELQNVMFQIMFNIWIYNSFGAKAMGYLLIGSGLGKFIPIQKHLFKVILWVHRSENDRYYWTGFIQKFGVVLL